VTHTVAVIAYPRISNLDEFQALKNVTGVRLLWARSPADLAGLQTSDCVILPGSKHTSSDLAWLRQQGLDLTILQHARKGGAVLGICGGLQMLGEVLIDEFGIDGNAVGLGLLPIATQFSAQKTVQRTQAEFLNLHGTWSALSGVKVSGYEIHHGNTKVHSAITLPGDLAHEVMLGLTWQNKAGNVLGTYLHGLFEDPAVLQAMFGMQTVTMETVFEGLADYLEQHMGIDTLQSLIQPLP
jgi:adenosylcobyric acid synthase